MAPTFRSYTLRHPQAVAWAVLLTSFGLLCLILAVGTVGARWFLFDSQVDLTVRLTVGRGRVDLALPDGSTTSITRQHFVPQNALIVTDNTAQGYLTFEDNYSKQVVGTVYLVQGSSLTLERASRPRFEWSESAYQIRLGGAVGRFVVDVPMGGSRPLQLEAASEAGTARFTTVGKFRLYTSNQHMDLHADQGTAALISPTGETQPVAEGEIGYVRRSPEGTTTLSARPTHYEMLNSGFGGLDDIHINPALPIGWGCSSRANRQNEPQGNFARSLYDNQVSLLLYRRGQGLDHAETACLYTFSDSTNPVLTAPRRRDISEFDSLFIRARVKIRAQDVTTCGIQGSECPVMLELTYLGAENAPESPQVWRHGFYAIRTPTDDNPTICDTCLQEHEKVNLDAWYIYDSGDLFKVLPANRKPVQILQLRVYSSGHAYDAVVSDLAVIGGRRQ